MSMKPESETELSLKPVFNKAANFNGTAEEYNKVIWRVASDAVQTGGGEFVVVSEPGVRKVDVKTAVAYLVRPQFNKSAWFKGTDGEYNELVWLCAKLHGTPDGDEFRMYAQIGIDDRDVNKAALHMPKMKAQP